MFPGTGGQKSDSDFPAGTVTMWTMELSSDHLFRLGLLLSGGGTKLRRAVASADPGADLLAWLTGSEAFRANGEAARRLAENEARTVLERVQRAGWRWIVPTDAEYPPLLTAMNDAPLGLFAFGHLENAPTVAIVGSRKATPYGHQVATLLAEELARAGVVVVSGMARGIDEAAHRGSLQRGGQTWAVWGCGPDRIYPAEHAELAREIGASGALLTEYPPGTPPRRHHFPERNRILAGLSRAVVVVEAAARSGALVTARLASEEGREVLAVPGNIFSEVSVGPNTLIRVGARPLLTPRDLFDAIGCEAAEHRTQEKGQALLDLIDAGEALTVDEIAARAAVDVAQVPAELLGLELSGELRREPDGRYSRARLDIPEGER